MPPVYKYRGVGETSTFTTITDYFRLYKLDVATNAEEGSVAQSTIQADDPLGALDIVGHRQIRVSEDSATGSNATIYAGYTAGRRISRGDYRTAAARVWDIDLVDLNSVLSRRVMTGNDCNRPAETDVARLQWLLTTGEAVLISDDLYLNTSGAVAMDAVDYRGQRLSDIIDDCAQASGKNYFVWFREQTDEFSLWYDFASSTSYSSPLRLTNVASEIDSSLTFAISDDTQLSRSPDRVNSGAYLPYDGGAVYVQQTSTANAFARRDAVMPSENVKSQAKATTRATRYLGTMDTEEDVITTTVLLPAAKVNFLMQGMRVQVKATHLPGYEGYSWARVLNRSVSQLSEEYYEVKCEMSVGTADAAPGMFQHTEHPSDVGELSEGETATTTTFDVAPGVGSILVAAFVARDNDTDVSVWPAGWTEIGGGSVSLVGSVGIVGRGWGTLRYKVSAGAADQSLVVLKGSGYYSYTAMAELVGVSGLIDFHVSDNVGPVGLPPAPAVGPVTVTEDGQIVIGFASIAGIENSITLSAPLTEMENGIAGASPTTTFAYTMGTVGNHTLNATSNTTGADQGYYMGVVAVFG